jgi:hypothetical protein
MVKRSTFSIHRKPKADQGAAPTSRANGKNGIRCVIDQSALEARYCFSGTPLLVESPIFV